MVINRNLFNFIGLIASLIGIWSKVDPSMSLTENCLRDMADVEDFYFYPKINEIMRQLKLPEEQRTKHVQASTLSGKLSSLTYLTDFVASRNIYIGKAFID